MTQKNARPNRLAREASPYLQQHSRNPVDWYPWGEEALARAKRENKPIFLSVGYSACHWCHVMEEESFEDEETAKLMNASFVNIKVDREERPDIDHIYMNAVQVMTQHGGWPMSVFLTPDREPFYGGTYFPKEDRMGMPSFKKILTGVANAWSTRREEVTKSAQQLTAALDEMSRPPATSGAPRVSLELVDHAVQHVARNFDTSYGGFGSAPKFFHTMNLRLLLRQAKRAGNPAALQMVKITLDHLTRGGIYDQLGGGFHRYSTDQQWLVPHFEKMLYDNALLSELYLETYQATRDVDLAQTARETLDYVLREMTSPEGGFYSTQDADSEGVEGKFYVWTRAEIFALLDKEGAEQFCKVYDVTERGNWEGHTILNRPRALAEEAQALGLEKSWLEDSLSASRRKLYAARAKRVAPFRDEKILTSWNGMMIESFAKGYQVLGDERYLAAARAAADFLLEKVWLEEKGEKRLRHVYKDGMARTAAFIDDYACLVNGLVSLYESDFDVKWIRAAKALTETMITQFWDATDAGFFLTAQDHEKLITRPKDLHDGATPSGSAMAVQALIRLGQLTGNVGLLDRAEKALQAAAVTLHHIPTGTGQSALDLEWLLSEPREVVLIGGESAEDAESALRLIRETFSPNQVVACAMAPEVAALAKEIPLFADRKAVGGEVTLYVCRRFTCQAPVHGLAAIEQALK